ncbi:MAG TPA: DUF2142 domain-containing protein [Candidatus Lachnoclostridium pullistercoris]|uniref:DUF2142 domain-containing protein n=1 Tax=Candidatus Lachnoclostridium pullistercoris TaxID=2838632 RepID=A0A9D2T5A9_9FIRM|nr:DUF2142 domain-containing protein [Candidatus Lachnoclostridium pullistercoris]
MYLAVLAPLSAPDEVSHFISSYRLSNTILGQPAADGKGHVYIRTQDAFVLDTDLNPGESLAGQEETKDTQVLGQTLTEHTYRKIHDTGLSGTGTQEMETTVKPPVETTPLAYLPQALGIVLGRLLGLGGLGLLYLGRFGNLLFFAGITWYAMRQLPFGKEVLFGVTMLPMTLHLAASFSYDAMILSLSFLFSAVTLKLTYGAGNVRKRDVALMAAVMGVLGPCKMIYGVLLGLCLLIPVKKFGNGRNWLLSAAAVLAVYAGAMILVNSATIAQYAAETESFVGWAGESGYTFEWVLHNPVKTLRIFYNTILEKGDYYHLTMMGNWLGNLDQVLDVPYVVILAMTFTLFFLAMKKPGGETVYLAGGRRAWALFLCLACVGAAMFSMFIAWTPASSSIVMGVQGRYFLPFLPVFLMALKNNWITLTKNRDRELLFFLVCANGYVLLRLFSIVSIRI